jgi:aspartate kinase
VSIPEKNLSDGLVQFQKVLAAKEIPLPQLLASEVAESDQGFCLFLAGPAETIEALRREFDEKRIDPTRLTSVTATCSGASTPEIATLISQKLKGANIIPRRIWMSAMSCTIVLERLFREEAIQKLHELIEPS